MSVTAIVTVTMEITVPSMWDDKTTMEQIKKQALEDARKGLDEITSRYRAKVSNIKFLGVHVI